MTERRVLSVPRAASRLNGKATGGGFRGRAENLLSEWTSGIGSHTILFRVGATLVTLDGVVFPQEAIVRAVEPQQVHGWGERPALRVHEDFGWHLIPDRVTRLRWGSYDYVARSNHLGFPGPLYPESRTRGSYRIMTVGDASTSAEGVDTDESWPRQVEREMRERLEPTSVEMLSFAITGYGPNQYAAILAEYGPRYRPDLVVIGFPVNDYFDALLSKAWFRSSIALDPSRFLTHLGFVALPHLRRWLRIEA